MKNKLLAGCLIAASFNSGLLASSEDATLTDIKESLVYLIQKYDALERSLNGSHGAIKKIKKEVQQNAQHIQENKITISSNKKEIEVIERDISRFTKAPAQNSKYDKVIKNFIDENSKGK